MKNITILFRSKKGTTNAFAREIGYYLKQKGNNVTVKSIDDYSDELVQKADIVFLGCWTQGMFLMFQHPDREWKQFAKHLPPLKSQKTVLFTTYKVYTGKMFKSMHRHLKDKISSVEATIKSRNNSLSDQNKHILDTLVD
ncbi:flavodoxin family protein [Saccharicrinis sp. FJH62]|uniref:flavodoxin family protein n=1 Tax=Saccharicrinis sp. FJH62 TaxID=3344657 RepID=UPI0035D4BCCC